jgi:hypothetical protein
MNKKEVKINVYVNVGVIVFGVAALINAIAPMIKPLLP